MITECLNTRFRRWYQLQQMNVRFQDIYITIAVNKKTN